MLRIEIADDGPTPVVRVAGRLSGDAVDQVARASDRIGGSLVLDLSEVLSADDAGISLLRALRTGGAEVRGLSPYLEMLLNAER
jgi:anti-anti-sigma regulatory factor